MAVSSIPDPDASRVLEDLTGTTIGRFAIKARIGQGGMGEVYLAEDTTLHRKVALKRVPPRLRTAPHYRQQFLAEAERASQLNHPHIAAIYDILESGADLFLVMEYVDGHNLRQRLQRPVPMAECLEITIQVAEGLKAAHERGLVHCDIKPENVMLDSQGKVKILDFGIARRVHTALIEAVQDAPTLATQIHSFSGTPAYMAPELLLNRQADARTDIFSLGVMLYESLTGQNPFRADTVVETASRVLREMPPALNRANPKLPPQLAVAVNRMMAKRAADRYASAADLLTDLRRIAQAPPSYRPHLQRRTWKWLSLATMVVVVVLASWLIARHPGVMTSLTATPAVTTKQLAVLPFTTPDARTRPFSDGLSETLAAKLSQLGDRYPIEVVPASEIRKEGVNSIDQAQRVLGVNLVIEGTLRESSGLVRVTYSLVDAKTRRQVRGDSITADLSNPFAVEDKVVDSILSSLQIALLPQDRQALMARGTTQPRAYDYYLQGRGYLQDFHKKENIENAITEFRQALQLDPKYALAWAGTGEAYWYRYEAEKDPSWAKQAQEACEHAVQLDPSSAGAHTCLGTVENGTGRYEDAVKEFQKAISLEPTGELAHMGLAGAYEQLHRFEDAERAFKHAISLRPSYWGGYNRLGVFYYNHGRYQEALEMFNRVVALAPDNLRGYSNLGGIYLALDEYGKAVPVLERAVSIQPQYDSYSNLGTAYFYQHRFDKAANAYERAVGMDARQYSPWGNLAEAYFWIPGRQRDAERAYRKAIELARQDLSVNPRDPAPQGDLAAYFAMLGDRGQAQKYSAAALTLTDQKDSDALFKAAIVSEQAGNSSQALAYLQKSVAAGYSPNRVRDNPVFADLSSDPRFQALVKRQ